MDIDKIRVYDFPRDIGAHRWVTDASNHFVYLTGEDPNNGNSRPILRRSGLLLVTTADKIRIPKEGEISVIVDEKQEGPTEYMINGTDQKVTYDPSLLASGTRVYLVKSRHPGEVAQAEPRETVEEETISITHGREYGLEDVKRLLELYDSAKESTSEEIYIDDLVLKLDE